MAPRRRRRSSSSSSSASLLAVLVLVVLSSSRAAGAGEPAEKPVSDPRAKPVAVLLPPPPPPPPVRLFPPRAAAAAPVARAAPTRGVLPTFRATPARAPAPAPAPSPSNAPLAPVLVTDLPQAPARAPAAAAAVGVPVPVAAAAAVATPSPASPAPPGASSSSEPRRGFWRRVVPSGGGGDMPGGVRVTSTTAYAQPYPPATAANPKAEAQSAKAASSPSPRPSDTVAALLWPSPKPSPPPKPPPLYTPLRRGGSLPSSWLGSAARMQQPQAGAAPPPPPPPARLDWCPVAGSSHLGVPWGLRAIGAAAEPGDRPGAASLPTAADHVLLCLISSGVPTGAPALAHNRWAGCKRQDPLDPGGCVLPWSTPAGAAGFTSPRGGWLAGIAAGGGGADARGRGVVPSGVDVYVVPVDRAAGGAIEPGASAPAGASRVRAYSACEGRLRGLQAAEYGRRPAAPYAGGGPWYGGSFGGTPAPQQQQQQPQQQPRRWRMVVLADIAAPSPVPPRSEPSFAVGEAEFFAAALGPAAGPGAADILVVAPAGAGAAPAYPAALPQVLAVGGVACDGAPLAPSSASGGSSGGGSSGSRPAGGGGKADLFAPGGRVPVPSYGSAPVQPSSSSSSSSSQQQLWEDWRDQAAAAAYAAGAAVRLWGAFPACGAAEVRAALLAGPRSPRAPAAPLLDLRTAAAALAKQPCAKGAAPPMGAAASSG